MESLSGTFFILILHMYIWMKWAKTDFHRSEKGVKLFGTRTLDLFFTILLTLWSIKEVTYWSPDNIMIRTIIDISAVGIIIWYRVFKLPNKHSQK